jgi:hypothetical protein
MKIAVIRIITLFFIFFTYFHSKKHCLHQKDFTAPFQHHYLLPRSLINYHILNHLIADDEYFELTHLVFYFH